MFYSVSYDHRINICKIAKGRKGVLVTNFFIANTMFIDLPVNIALFGDVSIPSVMLYYVVNLVFLDARSTFYN